MRYPPQPGQAQPRGDPLLSPDMYTLHAAPLPQCLCTLLAQDAFRPP